MLFANRPGDQLQRDFDDNLARMFPMSPGFR